jgi:hypothetical protein
MAGSVNKVIQYKMVRDHLGFNQGDIVTEYLKYDYGMKSDHERITGEKHVNVWQGKFPYITTPISCLKKIQEKS